MSAAILIHPHHFSSVSNLSTQTQHPLSAGYITEVLNLQPSRKIPPILQSTWLIFLVRLPWDRTVTTSDALEATLARNTSSKVFQRKAFLYKLNGFWDKWWHGDVAGKTRRPKKGKRGVSVVRVNNSQRVFSCVRGLVLQNIYPPTRLPTPPNCTTTSHLSKPSRPKRAERQTRCRSPSLWTQTSVYLLPFQPAPRSLA